MSAEPQRLRGLYAVTPTIRATPDLVARVEAAIQGGATIVQYRAKGLDDTLACAQATALAATCRAAGVPLIVNDSVPLALAAGADGVHLGREDMDVAAARTLMPRGIIGVSCYADAGRARGAAEAGADYIAIGSVFASRTKPGAVHAPLATVTRAREAAGLPVAAIGGIDADNAAMVIAAGADMVAVISAVFEAGDVREAARRIARLFENPRNGHPDVRTQPRSL